MKNTTKTPKDTFFVTKSTKTPMRKTTKASQPSIQPLRHGQISAMIRDVLNTNPNASTTDVYASMLRKMGISLRNTSLESYLRRMSSYPNYSSVEKIYTAMKRTTPTPIAAPYTPVVSGKAKSVTVHVKRNKS